MKRSEYKYRARLVNGPRGWIYLSKKPPSQWRIEMMSTIPTRMQESGVHWWHDIKPWRIKDFQRNPHFRKAKP